MKPRVSSSPATTSETEQATSWPGFMPGSGRRTLPPFAIFVGGADAGSGVDAHARVGSRSRVPATHACIAASPVRRSVVGW